MKLNGLLFLSLIITLSSSFLVEAARLPTTGGDNETWGDILNSYLNISLGENGTIRNNTISSSNIIDGAISSADISSSSINASHIIDGAITAAKLATGIITSSYLSSSSVNSTHIVDGTIKDEDISSTAAISLSKIESLTNRFTLDIANITSFLFNYNQTTSAISYFNSAITQFYNKTEIESRYFNRTDISALAYINSTQVQAYNDTGLINGFSNSTIARIGNCSSGQVVQNITTGGVQCTAPSATLASSSVNTTHIVDLTIMAADIANGVINATKLVTQIITADYLASSSVNSTHIVDGTISNSDIAQNAINSTQIIDNSIQGSDINTTTNVTVYYVNATIFDIGLESKTAECSTNGCTANATCSSGKVIIFGYGSTGALLGGISLSDADVECTTGATSCSATDNQALTNTASVKIICAKIR